MRDRNAGFGVFYDPTKETSGQRFFSQLARALNECGALPPEKAEAVLFNVSAPLKELVKARFRSKRIFLRLDGVYHDRLSKPFVNSFRMPLFRVLLRLGLRYRIMNDALADLANFVSRNYGSFIRALFAHRHIYQSEYARKAWLRYYPRKPSAVIVNGAPWNGFSEGTAQQKVSGPIRLATIYDGWRPSKRIDEVARFVRWANDKEGVQLCLNIIGFCGTFPKTYLQETRRLIEDCPYISLTPRFQKIEGMISDILKKSHIYITFTYRDACPNVVIEAMSHGLPVVAVSSGGLPDIIEDAGVLIPVERESTSHFTASRYENDFPPVDYKTALSAVLDIVDNYSEYRERVRNRFRQALDIRVVAAKYREYLVR